MDTVDKLSKYAKKIGSDVKIVGIPKTIDNDLCHTDHTPGFGSAAKYVASTMLEIAHDTYIYQIPSVVIVEIMGRDAGWLTAASCLARNDYSPAPHLIYLPEVDFDEDQFIEDIKNVLKTSRCVIVAVSEGIHDKDGNYISATSAVADKFGHAQLSGTGKALESLVKDRMDIKVRSIELNVLQRCAAHISSRTDINESFALGQAAVKYAAEGMTAVMSTIKRVSNDPYQWIIEPENVSLIANQAKTIPLEWITPEKNDVTPEMEAYLRPLIIGSGFPSVQGWTSYVPAGKPPALKDKNIPNTSISVVLGIFFIIHSRNEPNTSILYCGSCIRAAALLLPWRPRGLRGWPIRPVTVLCACLRLRIPLEHLLYMSLDMES